MSEEKLMEIKLFIVFFISKTYNYKTVLFLILFFGVFLLPEAAFAWGPATHLYYGMNVLSQLSELTAAMQQLLSANPLAFLYGSVSADIVLAKKLGKALTHCHRWDHALKLLDVCESQEQKAFAYGYLSHLAADTVSHNCYVPSKTIESYESGVLKHMYWELRFDQMLTSEKTLNLFQELARGDFYHCDELFQKVIQTRVLDFSFNKKVFNKVLLLQGVGRWQTMLSKMNQSSRWPLEKTTVDFFVMQSMKAVKHFLNEQHHSETVRIDPTGEERLNLSTKLRVKLVSQKWLNRPVHPDTLISLSREFLRKPNEKITIDLAA